MAGWTGLEPANSDVTGRTSDVMKEKEVDSGYAITNESTPLVTRTLSTPSGMPAGQWSSIPTLATVPFRR